MAKLNYIINIILSSLYIILGLIGMSQQRDFTQTTILAIVYILVSFPLFIALSVYCLKLTKNNHLQIPVSSTFKTLGTLAAIFSAILVLVTLAFCYQTYQAYHQLANSGYIPNGRTWTYISVVLWLTLIIGATTFVNVILFAILVKKNKTIALESIDTIGQDIV